MEKRGVDGGVSKERQWRGEGDEGICACSGRGEKRGGAGERGVKKECRSRWSHDNYKKNQRL